MHGGAMATRSLEDRVTALENTVAGLQNLPGELAAFRREVNARFDAIDRRFDAVDARFTGVDARLDAIDTRIGHESEQLYARMRLLHEALVTQIKTIGEGPAREDSPSRPSRRPKK
jgi:uncharacterized membrane protein YccC